MRSDGFSRALHVDDFQRRVEELARFQVCAYAGLIGLFFERCEGAGEPREAVVGFGEEKFLARGGSVPTDGEFFREFFIALAYLKPNGYPEVVGGAFKGGDGALEFLDVLDHVEPSPVEPAVFHDEWVFAGREGEIFEGCDVHRPILWETLSSRHEPVGITNASRLLSAHRFRRPCL